MLLAHRLPAVLCRCILRRHHSPLAAPCSTGARGGVGDVVIVSPAAAVPSGRRRRHRQRFPLTPPAVRALSLLVQPTGPQWCPIRPMPFRETAVAAAPAAPAAASRQQQ
ncbi:unnamed protein product, partial [Ectocarpus sp. 8 AP-2014]